MYSFLETKHNANAGFSLFTKYENDFQYIAAHVLDSISEESQLVFANVSCLRRGRCIILRHA